MTVRAEILVVGAGPIGLTTARVATRHGARVLVVEKRSHPGVSSCCTGLVSPRTLSLLNVSERCVLRRIRAVRLHFPGGGSVALRSAGVKAVVISRRTLEEEISEAALHEGVSVLRGHEVVGATRESLTLRSKNRTKSMRTSVLIGADGPWSQVARWHHLAPPPSIVHAAQAEVMAAPLGPEDSIDVFLGQSVAPGFFAWIVPAEDGIVRAGVGVLPPHQPDLYLDQLLDRVYPSAPPASRDVGWIPVTQPPRLIAPSLLLVGDAAGHTKPLSGGGLFAGGLCAQAAGEIAAAMARDRGRESSYQAEYVARCMDSIGREQAFGASVRSYASTLRDADLDRIAAALDDTRLLEYLARHADIDALHKLPDRLAEEPRLWRMMLALVPVVRSWNAPGTPTEKA